MIHFTHMENSNRTGVFFPHAVPPPMWNPHPIHDGMSGKCRFSLVLFLLGLFSRTEIRLIGSIGITELFCFVVGPFLLLRDWELLRKHRFTGFIWLTFLMLIGGWISNEYNDVQFGAALRGLALPYSFLVTIPVFHHFLQRDIRRTRWFFWGYALSTIISVYIFQRGNAVGSAMTAEEAVERITGYSLFWLIQLSNAIGLPVSAYYLELPRFFPVVGVAFLVFYSFFQSNNRSGLLIGGGSLLLLLLGGKNRRTMSFMKRSFWVVVIGGALLAPLVNGVYKTLAVQGLLGESAQRKYESQILVRGKDVGIIGTLKAGRSEAFIGLEACLKNPLVGLGAWARDKTGLVLDYYSRNNADRGTIKTIEHAMSKGLIGVPAHSWVVQAWLWYGILGLVWALAVGRLIFLMLRHNMAVYPHLYGYFAFVLPNYVWSWFFSPLGGRTYLAFFFTLCLFADWRRRENQRMGYVQ